MSFFDLDAANLPLMEEIYTKYINNPQSVDPSWRHFFQQLDSQPFQVKTDNKYRLNGEDVAEKTDEYVCAEPSVQSHLQISQLINAYRTYGHLQANFNPIAVHPPQIPWQLDLKELGFSERDLQKQFPSCGLLPQDSTTLQEIIDILTSLYCNKIGYEFKGMQQFEIEIWLQDQIESSKHRLTLGLEEKKLILEQLNKSELFESFLHMKYTGQKRFSLEGGETLIPVLAAIIAIGSRLKLEEFYLGMAHRGRLNVLSNILNKSYADIFSEFEDNYVPESIEGSGDVKYHKGFYSTIETIEGHKVKIVLTPNPSHLEAVDPVVEGQVKARQVKCGGAGCQDKIIPILIHGDAAISGQGVIYETLQMYKLPGFSTGGTVHIVINNQIGFTTLPEESRSTYYCTDIAKTFSAPVFHVNAEDPEGCVYATILAIQIRQKFHCDVFIDINCYRKYGHNESDEPSFTQPLEYQIIRKKKSIREIYRDALISQGIVERDLALSLEAQFTKALNEELKGLKIPKKKNNDEKSDKSNCENGNLIAVVKTGVPYKTLRAIGERICFIPDNLQVHPKLKNLINDRYEMISDEKGNRKIDWGMAELLAYGSLLWDGTHVRLSGQDCKRGTFSHRHAVWMDQVKEQAYSPMNNLRAEQGRFDVINSPLSEYAVLGFEFGYSCAYQDALVLWEAQFGDFCNGAQIIIDQFLTTAEQKWSQRVGLVLLLPHGYEGQGPEHSSARMERFLVLAGDENMLLVNPSTPAQLFHLIRKQIVGNVHKPLVVFTPKSLLRHPACTNVLIDFVDGCFQTLIDDTVVEKDKITKLVFCNGHIYYDLIAQREKLQVHDMAIVRLEQLYPLDHQGLIEIIKSYPKVCDFVWAQEEPRNMGAWKSLQPRFRELISERGSFRYVGRPVFASPAVGSHAVHKQQLDAILKELFDKKC